MKNKYRELCEWNNEISLFSQPWWLDAVAGDDWNVVVVEKGGEIHASLPFLAKSKYGLNIISQPQLTQSLGPWIKNIDSKYPRKLSREKDLMVKLIRGLPKYHYFKQNFDPKITNWLPFYWEGFEQTTRYTYRLTELSDIESVWKGLQENIRREINKAVKKRGITVDSNGSIEDFCKLNEKVFRRQGLALPHNESLIRRIDKAASKRKQRKIFIASDGNGNQHAAVYIVWGGGTAYYIMGGGDPDLRNSGAASLCMWEAIKFSSKVAKTFDFEGSMIEPIERFFRGFGAKQTPYLAVSRSSSKMIKTMQFLRENFR